MICRTCGRNIPENEPFIIHHKDGRPDEHECRSCDRLRLVAEYKRTGLITTGLWSEAMLVNLDIEHGKGPGPAWAPEIVNAMAPIEAEGKRWEREVWFGGHDFSQDDRYTEPYTGLEDMGFRQYKKKPDGYETQEDVLPPGSLQAFVIPAPWKGYEAVVDGTKYMSYTMCGRSIFQIEDSKTGHFVSMILDETSPTPRGGIRSIRATPNEALTFLRHAIADWTTGKIKLTHNEHVGFGF